MSRLLRTQLTPKDVSLCRHGLSLVSRIIMQTWSLPGLTYHYEDMVSPGSGRCPLGDSLKTRSLPGLDVVLWVTV